MQLKLGGFNAFERYFPESVMEKNLAGRERLGMLLSSGSLGNVISEI